MKKRIAKAALHALILNVVVWSLMILAGESLSADIDSQAPVVKKQPDVFEAYLDNPGEPADGFDFPVGDRNGQGSYTYTKTKKTHRGWYVATGFLEKFSLGLHPGEDWNGRGGGNTDQGQPVHAIAHGQVVFADSCGKLWGNVVVVQHLYYQNHRKFQIQSVYAHLGEIQVKTGEPVRRRQVIGTIGRDPDRQYYAHLHLELRSNLKLKPNFWPSSHGKSKGWIEQNYLSPSRFIRSRRKLFVPTREPRLVLVDQKSYRMRLYEQGKLAGEYPVSFGQAEGRKRVRGDNRTPMGMYFVVDRHRGKFDGTYGAFYGGHWIKVNYPNRYDAAWGRQKGHITRSREEQIVKDWRERKPTWGKSKLGGGIGFHGWIEDWDDAGPRHLSWGCIVMHNPDIAAAYERIPDGTMVVIF